MQPIFLPQLKRIKGVSKSTQDRQVSACVTERPRATRNSQHGIFHAKQFVTRKKKQKRLMNDRMRAGFGDLLRP